MRDSSPGPGIVSVVGVGRVLVVGFLEVDGRTVVVGTVLALPLEHPQAMTTSADATMKALRGGTRRNATAPPGRYRFPTAMR
jgi:hypothetical protein